MEAIQPSAGEVPSELGNHEVPLHHAPDSTASKYRLQLNVYPHILQKYYNKQVEAMHVVGLHPIQGREVLATFFLEVAFPPLVALDEDQDVEDQNEFHDVLERINWLENISLEHCSFFARMPRLLNTLPSPFSAYCAAQWGEEAGNAEMCVKQFARANMAVPLYKAK